MSSPMSHHSHGSVVTRPLLVRDGRSGVNALKREFEVSSSHVANCIETMLTACLLLLAEPELL